MDLPWPLQPFPLEPETRAHVLAGLRAAKETWTGFDDVFDQVSRDLRCGVLSAHDESFLLETLMSRVHEAGADMAPVKSVGDVLMSRRPLPDGFVPEVELPEEREILETWVSSLENVNSHFDDVQQGIGQDGRPLIVKGKHEDVEQYAAYTHSPSSSMRCELASWLVARALGDPFTTFVPAAVIRDVDGAPAVVMRLQPGFEDDTPTWETVSDLVAELGHVDLAQIRLAALFDAAIGQQDRNDSNWSWNPRTHQLRLIDHGFTFPSEAIEYFPATPFVDWELEQRPELARHELELLFKLTDDRLIAALFPLIGGRRLEAFERRVRMMLLDARLIHPADADKVWEFDLLDDLRRETSRTLLDRLETPDMPELLAPEAAEPENEREAPEGAPQQILVV
jgi:hypothetical protein